MTSNPANRIAGLTPRPVPDPAPRGEDLPTPRPLPHSVQHQPLIELELKAPATDLSKPLLEAIRARRLTRSCRSMRLPRRSV